MKRKTQTERHTQTKITQPYRRRQIMKCPRCGTKKMTEIYSNRFKPAFQCFSCKYSIITRFQMINGYSKVPEWQKIDRDDRENRIRRAGEYSRGARTVEKCTPALMNNHVVNRYLREERGADRRIPERVSACCSRYNIVGDCRCYRRPAA